MIISRAEIILRHGQSSDHRKLTVPGYEDVEAGIVKWPLSVIRLRGENTEQIIDLADHILSKWRTYTDEEAFIFAETDGVLHNTITRSPEKRRYV